MKTGAEFLSEILTTHLGFKADDEKVAALVKAVGTMELPDGAAEKFHSTFWTDGVAKDKTKSHHWAEFAGLSEKAMAKKLSSYGFTEDEIKAITQGKEGILDRLESSYDILASKLKTAQKGGNDPAVKELEKQIQELNGRIEVEKEKAMEPLKQRLANMETRLQNEWEKGQFSSLQLDFELPEPVKVATVKAAFSDYLNRVNGDYAFDAESGQVKLFKKGEPNTPLYIDNKAADFNTLKSLSLQEAKLIGTKSQGGSGDGSGGQRGNSAAAGDAGSGGSKSNTLAESTYARAFEALQSAQQ